MPLKNIITRFRAYQLGNAGSSFSYYANEEFTLIEARLTDLNRPNVWEELRLCGKTTIDTLHITSWDQDHCAASDLQEILESFTPTKIEHPEYLPDSESGKTSKQLIQNYENRNNKRNSNVRVKSIGPEYIDRLNSATDLGYKDILFWPKEISHENANDNSIIKFFRQGSFNVASLGDVEHENIGAILKRSKTLEMEMDILILAHHGADCATNSKKVFAHTRPNVAICSSNYDNQFDHPRDNVRNSLREQGIPLFTTKTGDVVIESIYPHSGRYRVSNLIANSSEISSTKHFDAKKKHWLSMNLDTVRNIFKKNRTY